jgi:hypothetical protein
MPTPRENTSIVKAPVLFRLPHLQRAAAKATTASVCGISGNSGDLETSQPANAGASPTRATTDVEKPLSTADSQATARPAESVRLPAASDESFRSRWGFDFKRSVILLAAISLLWGAWAIGQKSATVPDDSNLADINEAEPGSGSAAVAATNATNEASVESAAAPRVGQIVEPKLNSSSGSSSDFMPVTEPQPIFYGRDDVAATATSSPTADADTRSDFSQLSLDALQPPSSGEFYGDYDLGDPAQTAVQKLPVETDTNFVPTTTSEMLGFDPNSIGDFSQTAQPDNRPVFSSTPNGIIDWSRYLPGAGGNGSIRAVSATQTIGGAESESHSADTQAIYLDENDPNTPGVGVAPFYR